MEEEGRGGEKNELLELNTHTRDYMKITQNMLKVRLKMNYSMISTMERRKNWQNNELLNFISRIWVREECSRYRN